MNSDFVPGSESNAAVLMEIDGVLVDVHRHGTRQAFNVAFQDMGLDCAQWTESVYADLIKATGGDEEKMLSLFSQEDLSTVIVVSSRNDGFGINSYGSQIGWPTALPTNEQTLFVKKVVEAKNKALEKLALAGDLPLRPGLEEFVDEVLAAGVPLTVISAYHRDGEQLARIFIDKLGEERARKVRIVNEEMVENSSYGQLVFGEGVSAGFDEQLASAASRAVAAEKQRLAEEVAAMLRLSVEIDTTYVQTSKKAVAALRAGAEASQRNVSQCVLLAGGYSGVQAAQKIGMPCVVVRSSLTTRAEFPAAKAALDGYGTGAVTLPRLLRFL